MLTNRKIEASHSVPYLVGVNMRPFEGKILGNVYGFTCKVSRKDISDHLTVSQHGLPEGNTSLTWLPLLNVDKSVCDLAKSILHEFYIYHF